jgi:glycosyltransferase involved in cell wall biosynthesis
MSPPPWHISVLIPACNEAELLPRCIRSVLEAASYLPGTVSSDIVVVADRSTDGTAKIAADFLRSHGTVVNSQAGSTGTARALAVKCALARYSGAPEREERTCTSLKSPEAVFARTGSGGVILEHE